MQNIHPRSKKFNCQLHAQNKKLENACIKTFGKHGIGHCNVFQTAYVLVKMIKSIHEHGGKELLDEVHRLVVDKLISSVKWQLEAEMYEVPFEDMWSRLMAEPGDDTADSIIELWTTHVRNIDMPNFGRWMSIFPSMFLLCDNWTMSYFMVVSVKQSTLSKSSLSPYDYTLLSLMNTGSGPPGTQVKKVSVVPYMQSVCSFVPLEKSTSWIIFNGCLEVIQSLALKALDTAIDCTLNVVM